MKLRFKQRFFSWLDSYDIYDENGEVYFTVEGKVSWGHKFHIYDKNKVLVGILKQHIFTFLPKLDIYDAKEIKLGTITKNIAFFRNSFTIDMNGWYVDGDWFGWDYKIFDDERIIASISKELFNFTDTYTIDVAEENALNALLVVLSIDAINCSSRGD